MKVRDSGMPPEKVWAGFFSPEETLRRLGLSETIGDVADLGCGYGTFALPAAQIVRGRVYALDIDAEMIAEVQRRAREQSLHNLAPIRRDFMAEGSGLAEGSVEAVLLFNILHAEDPVALLKEARRILSMGGSALVTHWVSDRPTPRGPSLEIRPSPEKCASWAREAGFSRREFSVELPPYHYGLVFVKGSLADEPDRIRKHPS